MYFFTLDEVIDACMEYVKAEFITTINAMIIAIVSLIVVSIFILIKLSDKEDKNNGK